MSFGARAHGQDGSAVSQDVSPPFIASNDTDRGKKTLEHRSAFIPFANTEGVGFRTFAAASHQEVIEIFWLNYS